LVVVTIPPDCCLGDANGMDENDEGNFEKETFRCREELGFTETDVGELRSFISYSMCVASSPSLLLFSLLL